jgi:hypothetical protein
MYKRYVFQLITAILYLSKNTLTKTSIFFKEIPKYCNEGSGDGDTQTSKT